MNGDVENKIAWSIIKVIVFGVVFAITAYWAGYVMQGAQKAFINEAIINQMAKNVVELKGDMKADSMEIKIKLDKLVSDISKLP